MADYISPHSGPYHSNVPLGYGFDGLGLNVNLAGWYNWEGKLQAIEFTQIKFRLACGMRDWEIRNFDVRG